jgi:hypothetical protein
VTATIWRTCPSCGASFEQPDDPGRKRVYCSRACQQAAYRARQRHNAGQRHSRQNRRSDHRKQRHQHAGSHQAGAGQRHHQRQDQHSGQREQRRPPPHSANGQRAGATSGDDLARIRRIIAALLRKAAATSFPHEATACARRPRPYAPSTASRQPNRPSRPGPTSRRAGGVLIGSSHRPASAERSGSSRGPAA